MIMFRKSAAPPLMVPGLLTLAAGDYPADKVYELLTSEWQSARDIGEKMGIDSAAKAGDLLALAPKLLEFKLSMLALSNAGLIEVAEYKPPATQET